MYNYEELWLFFDSKNLADGNLAVNIDCGLQPLPDWSTPTNFLSMIFQPKNVIPEIALEKPKLWCSNIKTDLESQCPDINYASFRAQLDLSFSPEKKFGITFC